MTAGRRPLDELFALLADPTRRDVLERLVHGGPQTATALATDSPLTRQAIVRHLRALADAGLATPERDGREVRYRATPAPLADAVDWLLRTGEGWDRRAARLAEQAASGRRRGEVLIEEGERLGPRGSGG